MLYNSQSLQDTQAVSFLTNLVFVNDELILRNDYIYSKQTRTLFLCRGKQKDRE